MCPECQSTNALGVEEPDIYDGTLYYICSDCGFARTRMHATSDYRRRQAERLVAAHNRGRGMRDA